MPEPTLTLDRLLSMSPIDSTGNDRVSTAARELMHSYLRSQDSVHDTFFPLHKPLLHEQLIDPRCFDFNGMATLYTAQCICGLQDSYEIHKMLDEKEVHRRIEDIYKNPEWKKVGMD